MENEGKRSEEDLLTAREAAKMKGVSPKAIYKAVQRGDLPASRVLDRVALKVSDVRAYQPTRYAGRDGVKGRGGRPKGVPMSEEARARISQSQASRWAAKKAAVAA